MEPSNPEFVTVDGHISALWQGKALTMKRAIIRSRRQYDEIATALKTLAQSLGMVPNQLQATLWFTRKRVLGIKYDAQFDLFCNPDDCWHTMRDLSEIKPYLTA